MFDKDTPIIVLLGRKQGFKEGIQGEYRLEEAMNLLIPYDQYLLRETILHNKPLRDMLREYGAKALIEELKQYAPDDDTLNEAMDGFVEEFKDRELADFDILYHSVDEPLRLFGHYIKFASAFKTADVVLTEPFQEFKTNPHTEKRASYVGAIIHESPALIFDDYDEPGYVECTYIIREHKPKKSEMLLIYDSEDVCDGFVNSASRLHEDTEIKHLPMVYYDGRSGYMLVAEKPQN